MTVIANAGLVLKDSQGNKGIVKSFTDNDIDKISSAITDVGQVVDPSTHMPIEATTASVGVVQLATAQDIKDGTANKVVDAKELADVVTKIKYAGSANLNNPFSLFEPKWYPMKISNLSWILSDGSWYDGDIYIGAYNKLVEAYENGTDKSDTIGGVTVSYRLSSDGLRVTTDKSSVDSLYNATGTAWYFVIDTTNKKFVLPRSKAFMQFGDEPGKFTEAGLPNITGELKPVAYNTAGSGGYYIGCDTGGAFSPKIDSYSAFASANLNYTSGKNAGGKFDASRSSPIYKDGVTTVQPNSVTGYLYFYVGDIERDANIINVQELVADLKDQLLKDRTKNDGNDYYDDSDITSLIYAGNGEGTIRNEIANGNFSRVHPGQTIVGRVTGTTYIVVGCNIYKHRGDTELTQNHIGLMPIQLIGNAGNLLWSGRTWAGSSVNITTQGYAPWSSDNDTEGKNQTSCYKDSYIANTVLPKVDNLWLKPDFENQGISVLTFRNIEAISFDANATCMSNPNWRGCATNWDWTSRRLVLPSEPEIYGHYHWSGSPRESGSQHTQLPLYRHKEIHKVYPRVDFWLKDSASASEACRVAYDGGAGYNVASLTLRVCPLFLIA
jgi:hypothetical protein